MPPWKLQISQSVLKDLRGLPKEVGGRAASPSWNWLLLRTHGYEHAYRVRAGDYRIVYEVAIIAASHRKDVYRELK